MRSVGAAADDAYVGLVGDGEDHAFHSVQMAALVVLGKHPLGEVGESVAVRKGGDVDEAVGADGGLIGWDRGGGPCLSRSHRSANLCSCRADHTPSW